MKLKIYNRQKIQKIPGEILKLIEKGVRLCVKGEKFPVPCEACIILTDNAGIREINREHRGIDKETDVLSFPLLEYVDGKPEFMPGDMDPETGCVPLGDIVISAEKAVEQAQSYGHGTDREFVFLAVHGMLHLLGYDHQNEQQEKVMFGKQEDILDELGLTV